MFGLGMLGSGFGLLGFSSAGVDDGIAWEFDASTGSIVPSRGSGTASFTRATTATVLDHEGIVRDALSGEVRLDGMRRVENLVNTTSEALDNAAWVLTNATISGGQSDPLGGTSAYQLTSTAANGQVLNTRGGQPGGHDYADSVWIRRVTGSGNIQIRNSTGGTNVTVTSSWQRFSITEPSGGTSATIGVRCVTSGDAVDIWHPQVERVTTQTSPAPGEYVSVGVLSAPYHGVNVDGVKYFATTNGNTVASNVVTEAAGTALTNFGYLPEPASTNLVLQSENFGTTWAAVGTPTRSAAAARVGRVVLDLIGDDDGATAVEGYQQVISFTGNAVKAVSLYVKEGSATSSVFRLRDTTGVANRLETILTWPGGVPSLNTITGTLEGVDTLPNGVFRLRFLTTSVTAANTNSLQIFPAAANVVDVTATGNLYVGGVMAENALFCSSYIPTTTGTVTRNADAFVYSGVPVNSAAVTLYGEGTNHTLGSVKTLLQIDGGTDNERYELYSNSSATPALRVRDGGVTQAEIDGGTWTLGTAGKLAGSCALNDFAASANGGAPVTDTSGTLPPVTTVRVGNSVAGTPWLGRIEVVRIYNRALGADVQGLTA